MTTPVVTATGAMPFRDLAALLYAGDIGAVPVVAPTGQVLGVVSRPDLIPKAAGLAAPAGLYPAFGPRRRERRRALARTAGELMTTPAATVAPQATVEQAARLMRRHRVGLLSAERLDLCLFFLGELARRLAVGELLRLNLMPDRLHYLRVGQRGDVADVGEVRHGRDDPAHDLAGPGLGHVGDYPDILRPRDLADHGLDRLADLGRHLLARLEAGLERDVDLHHPATDVVDDGHCGRLGDLGHGERGRLDLLGAQAVPGHVDHVVDPAQDPEVPVGRLDRPVIGEVRPVAPVRAVRVLVVLAEIGG